MKTQTFATLRTAQRGMTLVELLAALAVSAVAVGTTIPNFQSAVEKRRLESAAAQLETDIQFARGAAVAHNRVVRLSVYPSTAGACYVVHTGSRSDCNCDAGGAAVCTGSAAAVRSMRLANDGAVVLNSNVTSMAFEPMRGTVTPTGTLRLQGREHAINVVVSIMGRVRNCSPAPALSGYATC